MSDSAVLQKTLREAAQRRRWDQALRGGWSGLFLGCATWLLLIALHKALPIPPSLAEWGWVLAVGGAIAGAVASGVRRVPLATAAQVLEARHPLHQRLSAALELSQRPPTDEWRQLVEGDAARALRTVEVSRLLPLHLPLIARWVPVLLAAVIGLGFVPEYRSAEYLRKRQETEAMRDTGRRLAEMVRHEIAHRPAADEGVRETLQDLATLGDKLSQAKLTPGEAVKELANAAKRLEDEARQLESDPALRRLQQAARAAGGPGQNGNNTSPKQLEKLQQSAGKSAPEALEKLSRQLQQAQKNAAGMQGGSPDAAAQQALAQSLSQMAQAAHAMGLELENLDQALDALRNGNLDRVLKDLQAAGTDLDQLKDLAQKMAAAQQSAEALGKDLAEQLERGQAEAAAQTLEKMARELQNSGLSPEQIQQIAREVGKALKPGNPYGKASELLEKAAQGLSGKQNEQASKNLADAANELRKMAEQAGNLDDLNQMLSAFQNAENALRNGKRWSQNGQCKGGACTGCSAHPNGKNGKPGVGRGGKPGRGVGTWADETGWLYYPEVSERWDNSGLNRPDMPGRGHTDRGDGKLADTVAPTKLQGQFSPGAMPSITLRGVSIKGQSTVQYEQAVEAAQSDARSALNQDQVPRAYRGAVKGYFDELK